MRSLRTHSADISNDFLLDFEHNWLNRRGFLLTLNMNLSRLYVPLFSPYPEPKANLKVKQILEFAWNFIYHDGNSQETQVVICFIKNILPKFCNIYSNKKWCNVCFNLLIQSTLIHCQSIPNHNSHDLRA